MLLQNKLRIVARTNSGARRAGARSTRRQRGYAAGSRSYSREMRRSIQRAGRTFALTGVVS